MCERNLQLKLNCFDFVILLKLLKLLKMYNIPTWINRETIQMGLVVLVTFGFHYYFISNRIENYRSDEPLEDDTETPESIIIEQQTPQA